MSLPAVRRSSRDQITREPGGAGRVNSWPLQGSGDRARALRPRSDPTVGLDDGPLVEVPPGIAIEALLPVARDDVHLGKPALLEPLDQECPRREQASLRAFPRPPEHE